MKKKKDGKTIEIDVMCALAMPFFLLDALHQHSLFNIMNSVAKRAPDTIPLNLNIVIICPVDVRQQGRQTRHFSFWLRLRLRIYEKSQLQHRLIEPNFSLSKIIKKNASEIVHWALASNAWSPYRTQCTTAVAQPLTNAIDDVFPRNNKCSLET